MHTHKHKHTQTRTVSEEAGSLKSQVSFAEYRLFYRALLQKRPRIFANSDSRIAHHHTGRWQGGEDAEDALSCRPLSAKQPLSIGLFCRNWPAKIRHFTCFHHPIPCNCIFNVCCYFPQNRPVISGSFAERDLQLKASYASSSPCNLLRQAP